jgi:hypothetical protein
LYIKLAGESPDINVSSSLLKQAQPGILPPGFFRDQYHQIVKLPENTGFPS